MRRFSLFLVITLCIVLTACQSTTKEEKSEVTATVTNLEYKSSYNTMVPIFSNKTVVLISQSHPAQFLVTISYEDLSSTFDDSDLYESVEKGDTIQMVLCKEYDKNGDLLQQSLQLPK